MVNTAVTVTTSFLGVFAFITGIFLLVPLIFGVILFAVLKEILK